MLTSDAQPPSLAPENRHPSNVQLPHSQAEKTLIPPPMPPRGVSCVLDPQCQPFCCSSPDLLSPHLPGEACRGSRDTELGPHGVTDQDSFTTPCHPPQGPCLSTLPSHTPRAGTSSPPQPTTPVRTQAAKTAPRGRRSCYLVHLSPGRLEGQGFPSLASKAAALPKH